MIARSLLLLISLCSCLLAEPVLRISKVVAEKGEGHERLIYTYKTADGEENEDFLWVEKAAIVTDEDIRSAFESNQEEGAISVTLTLPGAAKMMEATDKLNRGIDRMAIIIDGRIVSAPVVQAKLGAMFVITGIEGKERKALIRRLNGNPVPKGRNGRR